VLGYEEGRYGFVKWVRCLSAVLGIMTIRRKCQAAAAAELFVCVGLASQTSSDIL
jgi:hypothetical protein